MKIQKPNHGMNLRAALWLAPRLGAVVRAKPATDDVLISHPQLPRPVVQSLGRKDANRELTALLNDLWAVLFGSKCQVARV